MLDRILLQHRLGQEAVAGRTLDALEGEPRTAIELNDVCYGLAVENLFLDRALADCDASLKLKPGVAATLDSRGFVLMRLGRSAEALEAYNCRPGGGAEDVHLAVWSWTGWKPGWGAGTTPLETSRRLWRPGPYMRRSFEEMGVAPAQR